MTQQNNGAEERKTIHVAYRNELLKRQLSNAESFDRAVLTYSSAGLALSLAFLKDFLPFSSVVSIWALYTSWVCFVCAIVLTVASYLVSQKGIDKQIDLADDYYGRGNEDAYTAKNIFAKCIDWMNLGAGFLFIFAVILTTSFVFSNLSKRIDMIGFKSPELTNAVGIPKMQQFGMDAAPIPRMQAAPPSVPVKAEAQATSVVPKAAAPVVSATTHSSTKPAE